MIFLNESLWLQFNIHYIASAYSGIFSLIHFMLVRLYFYQVESPSALSLSVLGALALAIQRLLPAIQQVYGSWAIISSYKEDLVQTYSLLDQSVSPKTSHADPNVTLDIDKIEFCNVNYTYPDSKNRSISNLNLSIFRGNNIGIKGKSGCGKSTFLDLLITLLQPSSGKILVNDYDINLPCNYEFRALYLKSISHIPQSIFIHNSSLLSNIVLGDINSLDYDLLQSVLRGSQLKEFVDSLPQGLNTVIGELGHA